jgi:hypothetical protein
MLSSLKRIGRLSWWVGLSIGAMLVAACGTIFASACSGSSRSAIDAGPDARTDASTDSKVDSPVILLRIIDASVQDADEPTDASKNDLWNTICE